MAKQKKRALGRGLSALLTENKNVNSATDKGAESFVGNVVDIPLAKIIVNPYQPRTFFDETALDELSQSIKELGVIQPITVRKKGDDFELISGERRYRASKRLGKEVIPAFVRLANDQEMLEMALVENIQRQDLDAIEVALSYQRLLDEVKVTQEELSRRVGKNRTSITNYLRLLNLDPLLQTAIRDEIISMGHGRALLSLDSNLKQIQAFNQIKAKGLSVRQTEELVRQLKKDSKTKKLAVLPKPYQEVQDSISQKFNTKVNINRSKNGKGKITLTFSSDQEFERLSNLLK